MSGGATDPVMLLRQASALAHDQRMEEALECAARAAKAAPQLPQAAIALAQLSFETWRPAAGLFAAARRIAPGAPDLIRNHALSLAAEGEGAAADDLLSTTLHDHSAWLDGHRTLATLRVTSKSAAPFDESYALASNAEPQNLSLRLAWLHAHAAQKNWSDARRVLLEAEGKCGAHPQLAMAALFLDCEAGDASVDPVAFASRFAAFEALRDPGLDLCQTRHLLRIGDAAGAERVAERHIGAPAARMFWPYLSAIWRRLNDRRAAWLDGEGAYIRQSEIALSSDELSALAVMLRTLHRLKAPYPEQSVKGGTQTDRQLFFHPSGEIQRLRAKVMDAVRVYVAGLPEPDRAHPLMGEARTPLRFDGSWSVRLQGAGRHTSHTHVRGWISSAFYVSIPEATAMGAPPAGWLALGAPPADLGLGLDPYALVAPKPGKLVLFPSTMWHETAPHDAGERLTVAFDIAVPAGRPLTP